MDGAGLVAEGSQRERFGAYLPAAWSGGFTYSIDADRVWIGVAGAVVWGGSMVFDGELVVVDQSIV